MIAATPRTWAQRAAPPPPPGALAWIIRHGLWIILLVVVTVWEVLGFIFPVAAQTPEWFDHPTISQEIKNIIGTSLAGRVSASVVLAILSAVLTLHWAWRWPA